MNKNCLEGMCCPECKSEGPFLIGVTCMMLMYDAGSDDYGDTDWGAESYCRCKACDHDGMVTNFKIDNQKKKKKVESTNE